MFLIRDEEEITQFKEELESDFKEIKKKIKLSSQGVCVAASTLGSLEALL